MSVPVVDQNQKPLMPTTSARARRWIRDGKATPFWDRGIFCIRLNREPSGTATQPIIVGIDPGSKREGITVKSAAHTYLNIEAEAVTWVSDAVTTRREMRRARRFRNTPCRANRSNRARGGLPPSTKARWQWKLRLARWLAGIFPIFEFVVEDIKATTHHRGRRWNSSFSPLEVGKAWFYEELELIAPVIKRSGWETKLLRDELGLHKAKNKTATVFSAHCVDSWVLANSLTGGHRAPDNQDLLAVVPLRFHRRQLHRLQPETGGVRKPYGGTHSHGLKRGGLVQHTKFGLAYIGGYLRGRVSLHSLVDGKRITQKAKLSDCRIRSPYNSWRTRFLPALKGRVSGAQVTR
jgi:hypothetical protein